MFSDTSESVGSSDVSDVSTFEESSDSFCENDSQKHFWNKVVDGNENTEHRTGNNDTTVKKAPRLEFPDFQLSKQLKKGIDGSTDQTLEREREMNNPFDGKETLCSLEIGTFQRKNT